MARENIRSDRFVQFTYYKPEPKEPPVHPVKKWLKEYWLFLAIGTAVVSLGPMVLSILSHI